MHFEKWIQVSLPLVLGALFSAYSIALLFFISEIGNAGDVVSLFDTTP